MLRSKNYQAAFTLAEVLVTLGIIGIVAAMTLTSLIENYQKKQTAMRLKEAYSLLNQAVQQSELVNGEINSWNFGTAHGDFAEGINSAALAFQNVYAKMTACDISLNHICQSQ